MSISNCAPGGWSVISAQSFDLLQLHIHHSLNSRFLLEIDLDRPKDK